MPLDDEPTARDAAAARKLDEVQRQQARDSLLYFALDYFPHYCRAPFGAFHLARIAELQVLIDGLPVDGRRRSGAAQAWPREHAKSTVCSLFLPLWAVLTGRRRFVLVVSSTWPQAVDLLRWMRLELETNEPLRRDFGDQRGTRWHDDDLMLANGARLVARGAGQQLRGLRSREARPDLLLLDDVEDDVAVATEAQRRKLWWWLTHTLLPAAGGGSTTLIVGTILHRDALLARAVGRDHLRGWLKRRASCWADRERQLPIWPGWWPRDRLEAKRDEILSVAFACEYENEPVSEETALFRLDWLEAARERGRGLVWVDGGAGVPDGWQVVQAWDLAFVDDKRKADAADSDYTVGTTWAVNPETWERRLLRAYRARGLTPAQVPAAIQAEAARFPCGGPGGVRWIVVENNAAGRLHELGLRYSTDLPIIGHTTGREKHDVFAGVPSLSALFEGGKYILPCGDDESRAFTDTLINELHGLGREAHDDTVMSLWLAEFAVRRIRALLASQAPIRPDLNRCRPVLRRPLAAAS
jgi:phage terminase large subunit-like protein